MLKSTMTSIDRIRKRMKRRWSNVRILIKERVGPVGPNDSNFQNNVTRGHIAGDGIAGFMPRASGANSLVWLQQIDHRASSNCQSRAADGKSKLARRESKATA